jgi:hypothetical protein
VNDLSQIKNSIEATGNNVEIQQMCGITWTDGQNSDMHFTDGNPAVGEITASTEFGPIVIPVCQKCLDLISVEHKLSLGEE